MNSVLEYFSGETRTMPEGVFSDWSRVTVAATGWPIGGGYQPNKAAVVRKTVPNPGFSIFQTNIPRGWRTFLNGVRPTSSQRALASLYALRYTSAAPGVVSTDVWYEMSGHSLPSAGSPEIVFSAVTASA